MGIELLIGPVLSGPGNLGLYKVLGIIHDDIEGYTIIRVVFV